MMVRLLYNLCFPFVFLALLPGFLRRMVRRGSFRRNFGQRFGFFSPSVKARLAGQTSAVWVQAVSVGEMLVALKLIAALRARSPGLPVVVSTTTTTGYQLATERLGTAVEVIYSPVDLAGAVRRTFDVLRPSQLVVVDGGLWPNQLWEARRRRIPTALVNARLSPRSERRFRRFRALASAMFRQLDLVCVPEVGDRERWSALGVSPANVQPTGSIKFDDAADPQEQSRSGSPETVWRSICPDADAPVLLAGSTHPGEERIVAGIFLRLRRQFPDLFLIIAPRHFERAAEICAEIEALGLKVARRTRPGGPEHADLLLLDTTGELRAWYEMATVVFIGKSLMSIGGQNPAEAISAGKPVIFGPHMENFAEVTTRLLSANAAVQVPDAAGLEAACARLLSDSSERERLANAARPQIAVHRGAAARTAELLLAQNVESA